MRHDPLSDAIARVARELRKEPFGSVRVVDVSGELGPDADGDEVLALDVVLSDPGQGATWPLDDIDRVRSAARRSVADAGIDGPLIVTRFFPESPDPGEDGDGDGLVEALEIPEQP